MEQEIGQMKQKGNIKQNIINIFKFIGFMILALVPIQVLVVLISLQNQFSTMVNTVLGVILFLLTITIVIFLWKKYTKYSRDKVQKIGLRDIGFALLFFLIGRAVAIVGTLLITWIHGDEMTANDEAIFSITDGSGDLFVLYLILFVLCISILVPIVEELTYRGIGTNLLFHKNRFWLPLIITSSIFSLLHTPTNLISFLMYGGLGVTFFLAYYRRKNILDAMLVHILNNSPAAFVIALEYMGLLSFY